MSTFKTQLDNFLTDENIHQVQTTGDVLSEIIPVRFGDVDFREKDFIGTNITRETIFNSMFNRDLNLHNDDILADKLRYALEIVSGCAKIGILPVSYIIDLPIWKQGGIAHLHMKDRGHTVFMLSHIYHKASLSVWKKVIAKLEHTNCRGSDLLMAIKETIVNHVNAGTLPALSIADVTTKPMIERLNNTKVVVEVSIESLENHKIEIINLNNSANRWSTHMYGQITLQALLSQDEEPALDIDELYNTVKNLDVFLGKRTFLSGVKSTIERHYGHEDEVLMYYVGSKLLQERYYPKNKEKLYTLFEKTENVDNRQSMFRLIYEKKITTATLKNLARTWDKVADNPMWDVFDHRIDNMIEDIRQFNHPGSIKNLSDLVPTASSRALRWFELINDLKKDLNWGSDIGSLTSLVISNALTFLAYEDDPMTNPVIKNLKLGNTGRAGREQYFYSVLHRTIVDQYKSSKGARESKERKLKELRSYLTERGFNKRTFDVIDRRRASTYTLTTVDLMNGRGFELGHKIAGAEFTDENTFLQFPNDNRFNSAHNITDGYWIEYGSWVADMKEQYPDVDEDAFEDTLKFCELMEDTLI